MIITIEKANIIYINIFMTNRTNHFIIYLSKSNLIYSNVL